MNNKKYNFKSGFSLFEALVSMLILSLFFLASSRVITQKQTVEFQRNPHGYYECYIVNGAQWEHMSISNIFSPSVRTNECLFTPPTGVNFFNVHYLAPNGMYYNAQQSIVNMQMPIGSPDFAQQFVGDRDHQRLFGFHELIEREDRFIEFKTYLRITHPACDIASYINQNITPLPALLITW